MMLSKTPPMGWNTRNTFANNINEKLIKDTADQFVELGCRDCVYEYSDAKQFMEWEYRKFPQRRSSAPHLNRL